ncbi:hypothetical protein N0V83_006285 [Neocucurbitaria cava]|uniref:Uncharacterized protein n=1 Tax=Neocucurbitaria cava TaxID=798079 RepID=A0A9W8Y6P8_9PLEO|nr:hypothetical protein N0V83_006285 [Neocucurbitaria cava]
MLALSGSHLAIQVDNPQTTLALSHRQKAITGLEEAFTQWPPSAENAHIMLATTYLLSFQASYLPDGFVDMVSETAATPVSTDTSTEATMLEGEAYKHCGAIHGEVKFTNPLFPADLTLPFEDIDWDNITAPPSTSPDPVRSFNALMSTLLILTTWPYEEIAHVLSPTNQLGNVVMAHFCAMRAIVSPLSAPRAAFRAPVDAVVAWNAQFVAAVKDDEDVKWTEYVEWPKKIVRCLQACLAEKKNLTFRDLRSMVLNDPGAFIEGRASQSRGYDN